MRNTVRLNYTNKGKPLPFNSMDFCIEKATYGKYVLDKLYVLCASCLIVYCEYEERNKLMTQRDYYSKDMAFVYYDASIENMHCLETMNINTALESAKDPSVSVKAYSHSAHIMTSFM